MRGYEIALTADRSFMSDYSGLPFLRGLRFASTSLLHSSLFYHLVSPPVPTVDRGIALFAPYHTRRTEAALLNHGFKRSQVVVVTPNSVVVVLVDVEVDVLEEVVELVVVEVVDDVVLLDVDDVVVVVVELDVTVVLVLVVDDVEVVVVDDVELVEVLLVEDVVVVDVD